MSTAELEDVAVAYLTLKNAIDRAITRLEVMYKEEEDPLKRGDILQVKLGLKAALE